MRPGIYLLCDRIRKTQLCPILMYVVAKSRFLVF